MIRLNPWRDKAIRRPEQIDFENIPLGTIISWMDDQKAIGVRIDEYAVLRAASHGNNWDNVSTAVFSWNCSCNDWGYVFLQAIKVAGNFCIVP